MKDVLVLGAGKIGALISGLLAESVDYRVQLADSQPGAAEEVVAAHALDHLEAFEFDAADETALTAHIRAHKPIAVISGLPYFCNVAVARVARAEGCTAVISAVSLPSSAASAASIDAAVALCCAALSATTIRSSPSNFGLGPCLSTRTMCSSIH